MLQRHYVCAGLFLALAAGGWPATAQQAEPKSGPAVIQAPGAKSNTAPVEKLEVAKPAARPPAAAVTVEPDAAPVAKSAPAVETAPAVQISPPPDPAPVAPPTPAAEAPPQPPPPALPPEINSTITSVVGTMEGAEKSLTAITSVDTDLGRLRDEIDAVIATTTRTADGLRPRLADLQGQIDRLGSPPEKDAQPESPSIAAERTRLNGEAGELSGAIKTLEVTWWRARQAIDKITELRLQLFVRSLTERMSSPIFPDLWKNLVASWPSVSWRIGYNFTDWSTAILRQSEAVTVLVAAALALYFLLKALVLRVVRYRAELGAAAPSFFERTFSASWIAPTRAIPGVAAAFLLYAGFDYYGLLYYPTSAPAGAALLRSVLIFIAVAALLKSVFAPSQQERRLVLLSNRSARRINRLLTIMAAIYATDLFLSSIGQILYFPLSISVVQSLAASFAFAGVLIGLLLTPFEPYQVNALRPPVNRAEPRWLKIPLWIAAAAIIVACLLGYVALGRFLAQQIVMTGVVTLVATLLFLAIRSFTREGAYGRGNVSIFLEEQLGFDTVRRRQLGWLTESVLTVVVLMLTLPLLLLQWGFSAPDIRDWFKSLLFGFEIGQFKISLARILLGVLLFTAMLFATRLIQRRLRENVLIQPRMDPGIANSVDTAVGYAGTALAAVIAISYAGFDITNLAIVAGALSVGIGFGLQSIVNNFVSGLILLIERPIKVGDWVVVGAEQGSVKRISVRSTEIETFDRASLIVPNSELITGRVLNLTHRNALGRIVLNFSAGPNVDPRRVLDVLTKCAERHPEVLREPPPMAVFEGYTTTTTDYSLRVLLGDIHRRLRVQSDLRVAVYEAMKTARIDVVTPPAAPAVTPAPAPAAATA